MLNIVFSEKEMPLLNIFNLLENKLFMIKPSRIAIAIDPTIINFDRYIANKAIKDERTKPGIIFLFFFNN